MNHGRFGSTLTKYLLLLFFLGLLIAFFYWKAGQGITGRIEPIPTATRDYVAFLRQEKGGQTILLLVRSDGTDERPLTNDPGGKLSPVWSPDGRQIAYAGESKEGGTVTHQIFLVGGGAPRQATYGSVGKLAPQWRPDGKLIGFLVAGAIKVMEPNGSNAEQIYPHLHKGGSGAGEEHEDEPVSANPDASPFRKPPISSFRWSPNSVSIAAVQIVEGVDAAPFGQSNWWQKSGSEPSEADRPGIMEPESVVLLPGENVKPVLLPNAAANRVGIGWYPDGNRIAVALSSSRGLHVIASYRADEPLMQPELLFRSQGYTVAPENPVISPDGRLLAFEAWRMDSAENRTLLGIAVISAESGTPVLVEKPADVRSLPLRIRGRALSPQWSPDGKRLLYVIPDRTGRRDIFVANADGTNPVNLTKGRGDNFDPAWSPAK